MSRPPEPEPVEAIFRGPQGEELGRVSAFEEGGFLVVCQLCPGGRSMQLEAPMDYCLERLIGHLDARHDGAGAQVASFT